jgi:intein/homing endonuclease
MLLIKIVNKSIKEQIEIIEKEYPLYKNGNSKREIRHDFFKNIQTEIQAYLLGFHAADGSLDEKRKMFRLKLSEDDFEIIDLYKIISPEARTFRSNGYESKVTVRDRIIKTGAIFGIEITSKTMVDDLVNLGFGYRKTYLENSLPNIPEYLIRHFIRGYFDGDGCITYGIREPKPIELRTSKDSKQTRITQSFQIDSKTITIINEMILFFKKYDINLNYNYLKRDDMHRMCTSSKKMVEKIFHFLYDDSNFYLKRKFEKFNYCVNTEVSQIIADHRNA